MSFAFGAPTKKFAPPPPDTPYHPSHREWAGRMGLALHSVRILFATTCIGFGLAAILAVSLALLSFDKRIVVHTVEVDPQGHVLSVRVANERLTVNQRMIASHLTRFVRLVRTIPTDRVVLGQNWEEAYKSLSTRSAAQMSAIANEDNPALLVGRVARTVHVRSAIERADGVWEVSWIERTTNEIGPSDPAAYTGLFTVTTRPPRNADDVAVNPLGILITELSWSRER